MPFNVSRFLVRVRQFWTKDRLVPVLGITALFMFGLTVYTYISTLFNDKPIIARHVIIDGNTIRGFGDNADAQKGMHFEFHFDNDHQEGNWQFEHKRHLHEEQNSNCEQDHVRGKMAWGRIERQREQAFELREKMRVLERMELRQRLMKFQHDNRDDDQDIIIMHEGDEDTYEITVNGKKIEIKQEIEVEI